MKMAWYVHFVPPKPLGRCGQGLRRSGVEPHRPPSGSSFESGTRIFLPKYLLTSLSSEPCIRGHRSTKCTHANERLMVPVRKPGRPLSVCPHPPQHACGCGSVTAAIPRRQTCGCGSDTHAQNAVPHSVPGSVHSRSSSIDRAGGPPMPPDAPSPTKVAFKVQKSSKQSSSRKQSFGPANFERMDMNQVNVLPYEQRAQGIPVSMPNGYIMTELPQDYGFAPQYPNIQPQYSHVLMQPPPNPNGMDRNGIHPISKNGYTNGMNVNGVLENVIKSPLATPITYGSGDSSKFVNGGRYEPPETPTNTINGEVQAVTNGGSCCVPKQKSHSRNSSSASLIPDSEGTVQRSCYSSKSEPLPKQESISKGGSAQTTPHMSAQILRQNGINRMAFNPALIPQYGPQPTVFTYPATYGSFQNPLQPSGWKESVRSNNYSQAPLPPGTLSFDVPLVPETLDTVHTCSCGDTCQCIGCAAHPYNDATQEYVRSAWASMNLERPGSELCSNPTNENISAQPPSVNPVSSPTAHTPSSSTSGNDEEQNLSAADFFFVNYPFVSEGCGGDTQSCPCGDDCQCLGCTIHRQPGLPCGGEKESCPCEIGCQCIGCSIHRNGTVV